MPKDRVHKIIAQSGLMSRRKAEEAILEGRVRVNGEILTELGRVIDPDIDGVEVDGNPITLKTLKKTFLFYKPRGVVTTKDDPEGRATVMDYFKEDPTLNPVGRLDFDSEGLLLMTHDGELLLRLTHPRYGVKKIYEVEIEGKVTAEQIQMFTEGLELSDGVGKFDACEDLGSSRYRVTVSEGRNRFIRRMWGGVGHTVLRLKRVQMGEYELGDLKPGEKKEVGNGEEK